jgi:cobalt-zinc-cadmium resistance protein CzcA
MLLIPFAGAQSQSNPERLTVDEAISLAFKNNPDILSREINVQSKNSLSGSSFELPKTEFNFQYGQFNSAQNDNAFEVSQDIPFPTYFSARSNLYEEELKGSEINLQSGKNSIRLQVRSTYYQLQYLIERRRELQTLDSIYLELVNTSTLRYNAGETNLLGKTTAETRRGEIVLKILSNESEIASGYNSLKTLINTDKDFTIAESESYNPIILNMKPDSANIANNPSLMLLYQDAEIIGQLREVEAAQFLPEFTIGYSNQSIIGLQNLNSEEVYYNGGKRFSSFNVGIKVPTTFFSNNAKLEALELKKKSLIKEAENERLQLRSGLEEVYQQYSQNLANLEYLKEQALPNADLILSSAGISYSSGEIGYIEYLNALQTVTDVRLEYLESINRLNQSAAGILSLINK